MSAPVTRGQSGFRIIYEKIVKVQEEIKMKLQIRMTDVKTILSKGLATKLLGGLALGAVLMTATALPFGTAYADEPSLPLVSENIVIDLGGDNMPGDAWMFDAPFYESFLEVGSVEVQRTPDDAWMFDAPFYESFLEVSSVEVQRTPDDAWIYNSPFYETLMEVSVAEVQRTPDDAWIFHSPFYETLMEVSNVEVQRTPDDAWIFNAPFYEDLGAQAS